MGSQDRNFRQVAIPFYGQIMEYNRSEESDNDISAAINTGDLTPFTYNSGDQNIMVRILRPQFAQLIEAYLNISLTFDSTETSPEFYVSCGSGYEADGVTPVIPSNSFIQQSHFAITGQTLPLTGIAGQPLTEYKLNLMSQIPVIGSPNYSPDSFVIGINFLKPPVYTGLFHLYKFFVTGSALVRS